jgi:hypothetical protein
VKRYIAIATLIITILSIAIGQTTDEKLKSKADARKSISGGKQTDPSPYLFLWAGDADKQDSDFLAVVDARSGTPNYGRVITTLPVGVSATMAHHTEHEMPEGGVLFANGFAAGQTFRFDLRQPEMPRLLGSFKAAGGYSHPHSFVRLPNGNLLVTFQMRGESHTETGGLVELDPEGRVVRSASAAAPDVDPNIRPYSLAIVPKLDRVVTSSSDMHGAVVSHSVQVWRLSDFKLLKTIPLPPGPDREEANTAEPRVLADGRTVLVNTFSCGLYCINGLESTNPSARLIYRFPQFVYKGKKMDSSCALPVIAGHYLVQTVYGLYGLVSLDISNPDKPVEVSRLVLGKDEVPHWISLEPNGERIVVTGMGGMRSRVYIARVDRQTGELSLDEAFRDEGSERPGLSFDREQWPHGRTGAAIPHGAVFSRL